MVSDLGDGEDGEGGGVGEDGEDGEDGVNPRDLALPSHAIWRLCLQSVNRR
ncbi:hypothetical protein Oscil6304_4412 [Oscillatoria acuminata PCC 6304]|uniref:Uncharacterized protein n=1 Tax=Oscillatoria acuminata PCC 6304 TaxID=56110 RepID=K9TM58_9CYAN|nr:hypothetical protein Oscil6304_4412 [Oscillatoria acuminata PCC 6304]